MALKDSLPILLQTEINRLLSAVSVPVTASIFLNSITKSLLKIPLTDAQAERIREEILMFAERVYRLERERADGIVDGVIVECKILESKDAISALSPEIP